MTLSVSIGLAGGYGDVAAGADMSAGLDVLDVAHLTAQSFPGGVPALAQRMGVSANTLQHKLNPSNTTHHLTLKEALLLQLITGNVAVLHAMAKQLGYCCTRVTPDQSQGCPVEAFMRFQTEVAELTRAAADALGQGAKPSRNALRRVEYQAQELMAVTAHLVSTVAKLVPNQGGRDAN